MTRINFTVELPYTIPLAMFESSAVPDMRERDTKLEN